MKKNIEAIMKSKKWRNEIMRNNGKLEERLSRRREEAEDTLWLKWRNASLEKVSLWQYEEKMKRRSWNEISKSILISEEKSPNMKVMKAGMAHLEENIMKRNEII